MRSFRSRCPRSRPSRLGRLVVVFLEGVKEVSETAVSTAERLGGLFRTDRARLEGMGRGAGSVIRVHDALKARPIQPLAAICERSGLSFPTAASAMDRLIELGVVRELTGKRRNRLFVYDGYLAILNEGT